MMGSINIQAHRLSKGKAEERTTKRHILINGGCMQQLVCDGKADKKKQNTREYWAESLQTAMTAVNNIHL